MSYQSEIENIEHLTVDDIINASRANISAANSARPWFCPGLDHGTAVLSSEEQLCCYMAAYGKMNEAKLNKAFSKFPVRELNEDIEIIDWGCGQGIASVALINQLEAWGVQERFKKVTLIEPSSKALERAELNVTTRLKDTDVVVDAQNLYLPSFYNSGSTLERLHIEEPICIHLFSNILDISAIDLKQLATIVAQTGYRHYFICVGPMNVGNERIEAFSKYFAIPSTAGESGIFVNERHPQFDRLINGKWFGCVAKGFKMIRMEGKPFLVPLSYYPPKEFLASYRLDAFDGEDKEKWNNYSSFAVLAPFDIGASIYSDVDPVLAVLNNIVTRGLPTKCSPFIESKSAEIFEGTKMKSQYGSISFEVSDQAVIDKYRYYLEKVPVGVAWIQKTLIEAAITGRLPLDEGKLTVVVIEDVCPCAALAFEDFRQMYDNLCCLSSAFSERRFPEIQLHIINEKNVSSKLHLGHKTYTRASQLNRETEYDLVIDISLDTPSDPEHVQFSEFKAKNECYFNIRPCQRTSIRPIYTSDRICYKPLSKLNKSGENEPIAENVEPLVYFLQLLFRKENFRPGQLPILNRALQNKSVIGLLPTGGGKSLTYQMAAMLQPGVTVVIDPLKSLMEDQYDGLIRAGIDACTYINSELGPEERHRHEELVENSNVIIAFMSPERLCIYEFRELLQNMHELGVYFSYGVIDEVHCVSEWGQDFRFSYLHLGRNLYSYVKAKEGEISLFGLTATASFDVLSDVERELSGYGAFTLDPETIVRYENSNRLELQYKIEKVDVEYETEKFDDHGLLYQYPMPVKLANSKGSNWIKSRFLKTLLPKIPGYLAELQTEDSLQRIMSRFQEREALEYVEPQQLLTNFRQDFLSEAESYENGGIVFCPHVNGTGISVYANAQELESQCRVGTFSGQNQKGVTDNRSMENMRLFRENKLPLMVATKAFGMGIDKPNVRFTVNMNYSSSLESFIQEAGRAGRDRKMALSIILMADYCLKRIRRSYMAYDPTGVISTIKGHWFKSDDLAKILTGKGLQIPDSEIEVCNPITDMVRLICPTAKAMGQEENDYTMQWNWPCTNCAKSENCQLKHTDYVHRFKWIYYDDLIQYLKSIPIRFGAENFEYQSADYSTVMFFFNNNFKGELEEKKKMHELLSTKKVKYFYGNDAQYKNGELREADGFMDALLNSKPGTELVVWLSYDDDSYQDVAKAIYRMCVIGLIDDFTQDYSTSTFRVLAVRKRPGSYYERLKEFLMRYYPEDKAENEVEKASVRKGDNEIHKCLGYLTEFVYDKVVMKRKRAIDDMRRFCLTGIDTSKDWKEINEDLKDEIFFYFNSKFAREGYTTENDEPFSLIDDTDRGRDWNYDLLFKYLRVIDNDVIGASGSPKDNIRHLRGAVRLIRRSETEINPVLSWLNVFCLLVMRNPENLSQKQEIESSYIEGYMAFYEAAKDKKVFYAMVRMFKRELNAHHRNVLTSEDLKWLKSLDMAAELGINKNWLTEFTQKYTK